LLFFVLARRLIGDDWQAAAAGLVWAVHPLSTEAVTNIAGRADLLAALGVLGALVAYEHDRPLLAAIAAAVGVFAKESAVVIVALIALREWIRWDRRRSPRRLGIAVAAVALPIAVMLYRRSVVLAAAGLAEFPYVDNPLVAADGWTGFATA